MIHVFSDTTVYGNLEYAHFMNNINEITGIIKSHAGLSGI